MAWVTFQKSNWTRTASSEHARQYFPASSNGTATGNLTFVGAALKTITLTAAFQFQGNGPVTVSAPEGAGSGYATVAAQGIVIENAWLQGPASGSYAGGNHPLILVNLSNATTATVTTATTGFDLIAVQY
jgi:hypothetical protein